MEKEFETCGGSIETVGFWWVAGLTPGWALGPSIGPQTVGRVPIFSFKFHWIPPTKNKKIWRCFNWNPHLVIWRPNFYHEYHHSLCIDSVKYPWYSDGPSLLTSSYSSCYLFFAPDTCYWSIHAKKWILRVYYMRVLKSENIMKLRLSTSGVLVKCSFFTLGHFLAWNPWRKTPNLHIFDQNRIQMHVFQKNWCKHDINFQNKTRFLTKKTPFFVIKIVLL